MQERNGGGGGGGEGGGVVNMQGTEVPFVEGHQPHGGYHGSNDDVILCKVIKGLGPTRTIILERIPFEEGSVKCEGIVDEFLEIFQGNPRCGRGTLQVLKEMVEAVGPKANSGCKYLCLR